MNIGNRILLAAVLVFSLCISVSHAGQLVIVSDQYGNMQMDNVNSHNGTTIIIRSGQVQSNVNNYDFGQ